MPIQTAYTQARAHLAALLDEVDSNREVVIIQRRGAGDVALIAADELNSLLETAHLLRVAGQCRTPADRTRTRAPTHQRPQSLNDLLHEVGLGQAD